MTYEFVPLSKAEPTEAKDQGEGGEFTFVPLAAAKPPIQERMTVPTSVGTSGVSMAEAEEEPTRPVAKGKSIFERGVKMEPPTVDYQKNLETMRRSGSPESVMFTPGRQLEAIDQQIMRGNARKDREQEIASKKAAELAATK